MFYQEVLPKFRLLSCVDNLLAIGDGHWRKVAATFEKSESANSLPFAVHVHVGAYFVWVLIIPILRYWIGKVNSSSIHICGSPG